MGLRGQARTGARSERGYAMAALLVMVAVLTVLMSVAMPVWRHEAQREKEEELVFRGQQYVRAIRLYQAKTRALPPNIDALVQGHYLRKKYKDPITNDDFVPIGASAAGGPGMIGQPGRGNPPGRSNQPGQSTPPQQNPAGNPLGNPLGPESGANPVGGIIGVVSKSKAESIRVYQGRTHYNEWPFVFVNMQPGAPGGPGGPGGMPGGRGVPGGPGGRGRPGGPGPGGRGRNPGGEMGPRPNPGRGMPSPNRPPGGPGHLP